MNWDMINAGLMFLVGILFHTSFKYGDKDAKKVSLITMLILSVVLLVIQVRDWLY